MSLQQRTGWSCARLDVADAQHPGLDRIHRPAPRSGVKRQSTTGPAEALRMPAALPRPEAPVARGSRTRSRMIVAGSGTPRSRTWLPLLLIPLNLRKSQ